MDAICHRYYIQLFEGFLPKQLLQNVIDIVNEKMDGDEEVVYGEFIWWIGIWVLMSTVDGADQHSFWSTKNVNAFDGTPFRLIPFMSRMHFDKILYNLGYTKEGPPQYQDHFWEVQTMLQMWNKNIAHFDNKDVGDIDAIKVTMDGVPFHIQSMKDPDYIMMLISTYGMTLRMGVTKRRHYTVERVKKVVEFQYPEIVHYHYKFHDMIDNHNSFWMHPISMVETWMTMRHMFCFLLMSPLSTYKMQLCISSTSQNWMLCKPGNKLQSNSYSIVICWKKNRPRSIQDRVLLSTVSSWCQSTKTLSKGNWCPVR